MREIDGVEICVHDNEFRTCEWCNMPTLFPRNKRGPWRQGRRVLRTLYKQLGPEPSDADPLIGVMDTPELAAQAVAGRNAWAELRAEVVQARDDAKDGAFFYAEECVYELVLDLIDKHAREGQ